MQVGFTLQLGVLVFVRRSSGSVEWNDLRGRDEESF